MRLKWRLSRCCQRWNVRECEGVVFFVSPVVLSCVLCASGSSHLSFRPQPVLHLGDETVGGGFAPDKHVIKDSIHPNNDPLDTYFGF